MTTSFLDALAEWHEFYSAVAGITGSLVGLLFVALALRPQIMADDGSAGLRVWAGQTFHSFLVVLVLALIALVPDESPTPLVITLVIIGIPGIVRVGSDLRRARTDPDPHWSSLRALTRFIAPTLAYLLCLWVAWQLAQDEEEALGWLIAVVFLLLINAASNCWELLKAVGDQAA